MKYHLFALYSVCVVLGLAFITGCPCMPVMVDAEADTTIDVGSSVALSATVVGGDGNVAYQWQPATGLNDPTSRTPVATPTQTMTYTVTATSCEMSDSATVTITVNDPNVGQAVPTAGAGGDQTVVDEDRNGVESVALDASQSDDPDGVIVSYRWFENGQVIARGVAPSVELALGTHTIVLETTDDQQFVRTDTVIISVLARPLANAGADQTVVDTDLSGFEPVDFDGTASTDADGTTLSYSWFENGLVFSTDDEPDGIALSVGTHTITLTVTDDDGLSASDDVVVSVGTPGAPIANAGLDQIVKDAGNDGSESVTLDGSASTAELTITAYRWLENNLVIATGVAPVVSRLTGAHTITLEITDSSAQTATDNVTITVNALVGPTANAGADRQEIDTDNDGSHDVVLDASGSTDSDGQLVSFRWTEGGVELATTATATVTLAQGMHTIDLEVTDDDGLTDADSVVIDVIAPPPLSASAGPDRFVPSEVVANTYTGATVTLTATATGGTAPYTYAWSEGGVELGTIQSIGPDVTIEIPDLALAIHAIDLTVTDATSDSATDQATVAVFILPTAAGGPPQRSMCGAFVGICTGDSNDPDIDVEELNVNGVMQQVTVLETEPQLVRGSTPDFCEIFTTPRKLLVVRPGADGAEQIKFKPYAFGFSDISWSEGGVVFSTEQAPLTVLGRGSHLIRSSVTNINPDRAYTESVEATVIVNPPASTVVAGAASSRLVVFGESEVTLTATAIGGTGPYTYSWSPTNGLANPNAAVTTLTLPSAIDTYTVTITDSVGGSDTSRVLLEVNCEG